MNEFKVGLFALATMVTIVYMSLKITANQSGFGQYITYRTIVDDASGIFPKTPIKVAGISAGRIKKIDLQGNQALITFEVLERVKVTKGSKLRIKTVGFLGDKYLEVLVAKGDKRLEGSSLIESEDKGGLENLTKDVSEVLQDVKVIVKNIKKSVAPEGQPSPLKQIVADIKEAVENTKKVTESMKNIISDNEEKFENLIANLESFSKRLNDQLDKSKKDSLLAEVNKILGNVKNMTADLQNIASNLRQGKGTLGKILVEEEIADEVKETLAGVKKIVGKVDAIRTELSIFTGVDTNDGGRTEANLIIYPSPERFYTLGVTTSELGPTKEEETRTSLNGAPETVEVTKRTERDSYTFNVLLGRKVHNWSFRGGLIESTGGVGVDYEIPTIGTILTAEAFDYQRNVGINLRLSSEVHLWNVFYGRLAAEDVIEDTRSLVISGGLRFTDEDLKGLLGFFF